MANRHWKRFERSTPYKRAKLLMRRLAGRELWLRADERAPSTVPLGDWRLDARDLGRSSVVYSLGVGDEPGSTCRATSTSTRGPSRHATAR